MNFPSEGPRDEEESSEPGAIIPLRSASSDELGFPVPFHSPGSVESDSDGEIGSDIASGEFVIVSSASDKPEKKPAAPAARAAEYGDSLVDQRTIEGFASRIIAPDQSFGKQPPEIRNAPQHLAEEWNVSAMGTADISVIHDFWELFDAQDKEALKKKTRVMMIGKRYVRIRTLGAGAYGTVYKCLDLEKAKSGMDKNPFVALKLTTPTSDHRRKLIAKEAIRMEHIMKAQHDQLPHFIDKGRIGPNMSRQEQAAKWVETLFHPLNRGRDRVGQIRIETASGKKMRIDGVADENHLEVRGGGKVRRKTLEMLLQQSGTRVEGIERLELHVQRREQMIEALFDKKKGRQRTSFVITNADGTNYEVDDLKDGKLTFRSHDGLEKTQEEMIAWLNDPAVKVSGFENLDMHREQLFIVMQYYPDTLGNRMDEIRQECSTIKGAYKWLEKFCDLAAALDLLHSFGIIHKDIKFDNVAINNKGQLVLIDLGISVDDRDLTRLRRKLSLRGTPYCMSPEECGNPKTINRPADWHSFFQMIVLALTGEYFYFKPTDDGKLPSYVKICMIVQKYYRDPDSDEGRAIRARIQDALAKKHVLENVVKFIMVMLQAHPESRVDPENVVPAFRHQLEVAKKLIESASQPTDIETIDGPEVLAANELRKRIIENQKGEGALKFLDRAKAKISEVFSSKKPLSAAEIKDQALQALEGKALDLANHPVLFMNHKGEVLQILRYANDDEASVCDLFLQDGIDDNIWLGVREVDVEGCLESIEEDRMIPLHSLRNDSFKLLDDKKIAEMLPEGGESSSAQEDQRIDVTEVRQYGVVGGNLAVVRENGEIDAIFQAPEDDPEPSPQRAATETSAGIQGNSSPQEAASGWNSAAEIDDASSSDNPPSGSESGFDSGSTSGFDSGSTSGFDSESDSGTRSLDMAPRIMQAFPSDDEGHVPPLGLRASSKVTPLGKPDPSRQETQSREFPTPSPRESGEPIPAAESTPSTPSHPSDSGDGSSVVELIFDSESGEHMRFEGRPESQNRPPTQEIEDSETRRPIATDSSTTELVNTPVPSTPPAPPAPLPPPHPELPNIPTPYSPPAPQAPARKPLPPQPLRPVQPPKAPELPQKGTLIEDLQVPTAAPQDSQEYFPDAETLDMELPPGTVDNRDSEAPTVIKDLPSQASPVTTEPTSEAPTQIMEGAGIRKPRIKARKATPVETNPSTSSDSPFQPLGTVPVASDHLRTLLANSMKIKDVAEKQPPKKAVDMGEVRKNVADTLKRVSEEEADDSL